MKLKKILLVLPVLILLLSGCVTMGPRHGPNMGNITLQFVDAESGEPLSGGYAFSSEIWHTPIKAILSFGFVNTDYGNKKVFELNEKGEVTFPVVGYVALKGSVFVKNYEKASFSLNRGSHLSNLNLDLALQKSELPEEYQEDEDYYGPGIKVTKRHYKIPLKDITSDSEGWKEKIYDFSGSIPAENRYEDELDEYFNSELKAFRDKYGTINKYAPESYLMRGQSSSPIGVGQVERVWSSTNDVTPADDKLVTIIDSSIDEEMFKKIDCFRKPINLTTDRMPFDNIGHGSLLASLFLKSYFRNNDETQKRSIPEILPIKILDKSGKGDPWLLAKAIEMAIDKKSDLILIGSGSYQHNELVKKAVEKAHENNITMVAPAGNHGVTRPFYPAAYPEVISVTTQGDNNYGDWIDITLSEKSIGRSVTWGTSGASAWVAGQLTGRPYIFDKKSITHQNNKQNPFIYETDRTQKKKQSQHYLLPQWGVETHNAITEAGAKKSLGKEDINKIIYSEIFHTSEESENSYLDAILQGSGDEDEYDGIDGEALNEGPLVLPPTPTLDGRFLNHFWHREMNRELTAFDRVRTNALRWGLTYEPNDYRWEDAINRYGYTDATKRQSYYTLGFVTHLTQDMLVPDHVHDDPHAPVGDPSTLEDYVSDKVSDNNNYINGLADGSIADITSPYQAFAEGNRV